jgi:hypothetical protein
MMSEVVLLAELYAAPYRDDLLRQCKNTRRQYQRVLVQPAFLFPATQMAV